MGVEQTHEILKRQTDGPRHRNDSPYQGVHGCLLLFCLLLTFAVPFTSVRSLHFNYQRASDYFEYVDNLQILLVIVTGLRLFLALFSMYVGISLWTLRKKALRLAKIYLFTFLGVLILAISLLYLLPQWSESDYEAVIQQTLREVVPSLFFFVGCFIYLTFSKRVKATYTD